MSIQKEDELEEYLIKEYSVDEEDDTVTEITEEEQNDSEILLGATGAELLSDDEHYMEDFYCEEEGEEEEGGEEEEEEALEGMEQIVEKIKEIALEAESAASKLKPEVPYQLLTCTDESFRKEELIIPGRDSEWICKPDPCEKIPEDLSLKTDVSNYDPIRTQLAYGEMALIRLDKELNGSNIDIKVIATIMLAEYLFDPENIEKAFQAGIINTLRILLSDEDKVVREKTADCIRIIANHPTGCSALLQVNVVPALKKLLKDPQEEVRKNCHRALERISEHFNGARAIVKAKLIQMLFKSLETESEDIQELVLETLHYCLIEDTTAALECKPMEILKPFLFHDSENIRWKTARVVLDLSIPTKGKLAACENELVYPLVKLLTDDNACVRAKASGALMMITVVTEGKFMAIQANAIDALLELLEDVKFEVRINAIKALTNIAEAPKGRETLLWSLSKFQHCLRDTNPSVQTAAIIAIKVIQWVP